MMKKFREVHKLHCFIVDLEKCDRMSTGRNCGTEEVRRGRVVSEDEDFGMMKMKLTGRRKTGTPQRRFTEGSCRGLV